MRSWQSSISITLLAAMTACAPHAPVVYPKAEPRFYGVSFETTRQTVGGELPRRSDILAKDAKQRLQPGNTVAFLPPDSCVTTTVAPSGASAGSSAIMMECGALLASLEAEVAKAGYSVVSWQAIKGGNSVASQQRARELGVDVLFEVNELTPNRERPPGALQVSNMRFTREEAPGRSAPLDVLPEVAERCAGQIAQLEQAGNTEYLSTVNLKAVDVSRGRALWLYQNTVVEMNGNDGTNRRTLYYRADGSRPEPPAPKPNPLRGVGGGFMFFGGLALIITGPISAGTQSGTPIAIGAAIGLPLMALGGLMLGLGHKSTAPDRTVPPPTYPEPAGVLCQTEVVFDPWNAQPAATPAVAQAHSTYTFSQGAAAGRDLVRERVERLTRRTTEDFVTALRAVASR